MKKKAVKKKPKQKPRRKIISFQNYVVDAIAMLDNNIQVLKVELARTNRRLDDFETWLPVFRQMRDKVIGKPIKPKETIECQEQTSTLEKSSPIPEAT